MSQIEREESLVTSLLPDRLFGDDGEQLGPEAAQLQPAVKIREANLGLALEPAFERKLWTEEPSGLPLSSKPLEVFLRLRSDADRRGHIARRQARRLVYFYAQLEDEAGKAFLSTFLNSPKLLEYIRVTRSAKGLGHLKAEEYRQQTLRVLQEHFAGVRLPEGTWQSADRLFLTLNRRAAGSSTQLVLAAVSTRDFAVRLRPRHRALADGGNALWLVETSSDTALPLDLPLLDYVARRCQGEVAAELSNFYGDRLETFEAKLLRARAAGDSDGGLHLMRMGTDRRLGTMMVRFVGGHLEVVRQ